MSEPQIIVADPNYCLASRGPMFVTIWRVETTMTAVDRLRQELGQRRDQLQGKTCLFTVIAAGAPMPAAEVRKALADVLAQAADHVAASAVVFEGEGFAAAAVRSIVVGLTMLAKQPFPHRVFGTVPEAAEWLAKTWNEVGREPLTASGVIGDIAAIRTRLR